jgi:hypothetical protein
MQSRQMQASAKDRQRKVTMQTVPRSPKLGKLQRRSQLLDGRLAIFVLLGGSAPTAYWWSRRYRGTYAVTNST